MITREDCSVVGTITKTHGLQGNVIIATDTDLLERYADEPVFILLDRAPVPFFIPEDGLSVRNHKSYIVKFDYVETHAQAERLVGNEVMIEKRLLDEEGSGCDDYDIFQLNGFEAEEEATRECGKVVDVADYSGNIVLTIEIFGKEILLPFSEVYILGADLEKKKLLVSIPQDIIDLY